MLHSQNWCWSRSHYFTLPVQHHSGLGAFESQKRLQWHTVWCADVLNSPSTDTLLYIFLSSLPPPTFNNIIFGNISPLKHGINTKINTWWKVDSSCSEDYKTIFMFLGKPHFILCLFYYWKLYFLSLQILMSEIKSIYLLSIHQLAEGLVE